MKLLLLKKSLIINLIMNKDFIKTKSWFETLSEIIKDEFIGLNLTKDIGDYLIRENTVI